VAWPLACLLCTPAHAQFTQQGQKLVGTGAIGGAEQGYSVALSSDGNTAIVGGVFDNNSIGAAWIFTRSNGGWNQQGSKLVGANAVGEAEEGYSVAISGDGNTVIVGGPFDNNNAGAAWVFTRSNGSWTAQGSKLVGSGAKGAAEQGVSVALSNDGNTALVAGYADNSNTGAVWVFTRSNGSWSQQGSKLVGTGAAGSAYQGHSVSLSQDGNTALVGGYLDDSGDGAAWVFVRSGTTWSQQGSKLVGTGATGNAQQGYAAALSGDGNTAIVGGNNDSGIIGAAWIFTRTGTIWSQQGSKLVGTGYDASKGVQQGYSVGISGDGNTAAIGGPVDNFDTGATWVFTRSGSVWKQQGSKLVGTSAVGNLVTQGHSLTMSGDSSTLLVGADYDNSQTGAVWVFTQPIPGPCDVNHYGVTNVLDVQQEVNEALGASPPNNDLNLDGVVDVVDLQIDIDAAVGLGCLAGGQTQTTAKVQVRPPILAPVNRRASVVDLGTLGGDFATAYAVNGLGQVVGSSNTEPGSSACARCTIRHAFLWDAGKMTDLGARTGGATGINDAGQIVGIYSNPEGVTAINNAGQMAGNLPADSASVPQAFLWNSGKLTKLGTLGGSGSEARAINDLSQVVGSAWLEGDSAIHAFIYSGAGLADLGTLGGKNSEASGTNNAGQVVGASQIAGGRLVHAFIWDARGMTDLGAEGAMASGAQAINNLGQIVGWAMTPAGQPHAVLWNAGKMVDLNEVAPMPPGTVLEEATGINDAGEIAVNASNGRAYLISLPVQLRIN
jgi:probable HAF family extracellular repeat protein